MRACHAHGGKFIAEAPVSRGKDSPFAIPGRERHIGVLDHPSLKELRESTGSSVINFDQCCTRDDPTKTPQKTTALLASPNVAAVVHREFGPLVCTHPIGTHPSMIGVDESGELRSTKWENYSERMNRLLAVCLTATGAEEQPRCSPCAPCTPLADWAQFYSTDADRVETPPASVSAWSTLEQAAPYLGSDFSWDFYDTCVDGQCFAAVRERVSDNPSYNQAMHGEEAACWRKACSDEIENLRRHEAAEPTLEDTLPTWSRVKRRASEVENLLLDFEEKIRIGRL